VPSNIFKDIQGRDKTGFTLAEVLITLSIIGVVAALTVPSLARQYEKIQFRTAFKKQYSTIAQATARLMADNGGTMNGILTYLNFQNEYCQYLSCAKMCNYTDSTECWHAAGTTYLLNGQQNNRSYNGTAVLKDGTLLAFYDRMASNDRTCDEIDGNDGIHTNDCGWVFVDVNGYKGPNTYGKDIFIVYIQENKVEPANYDDETGASPTNYCHASSSGYGCAAKVLQNIDY